MPATQDAGSALVGKALALQDEAATRLHSQRDDWNERALNLAVRRAVIGQIYDRLRRTRDTSPLTLGHVYDALLDRTVRLSRRGAMTIEANANHRKATGVYYTPPAIIDHLINAAMTPLLRDANDGTTITLLDPACGTGWFLLSAIDRFKTWNQTNNEGKRPKALKLHLIGADIDPVAVHVARLSLTLANNQPQFGGSPGLPITFEVISGDSLLGPEAADDGIDWPREFPAIMNAGGFDVVIGNPPWVSYSGRQAEPLAMNQREYIEQRFTTTGWLTAHGLFIERATRDLSRRITAMVVPDQVGHLAGYRAVREVVARHSTLAQVRYWGEGRFAQAVTPTLTFVADRDHHGLAMIIDAQDREAATTFDAGDAWQSGATTCDLMSKLTAKSRHLGEEVADPGVHTGNCAAKLILKREAATGVCVPVLEGKQITRYGCGETSRVLRLDYQPEPGEYFRISAKQRYGDTPFVIRQTAAYPIVGPRRGATYFRNSLLALYPPTDGSDIRYLVGLLNSRLMRHVYRRLVTESRQKAFPQVKVRSLRMLPIRKIDMRNARDKAMHDRIVWLVQAMLDAGGQDATIDAELDAAIFELYGLKADEIDRVVSDDL